MILSAPNKFRRMLAHENRLSGSMEELKVRPHCPRVNFLPLSIYALTPRFNGGRLR
jgi:hypothetical protein